MNAVTWLGFAVEFRFNLEDFKYRGFEKVKSAEWVNLLTEILLDDCSKTKSLTYNFLPICIRWYIEYFLLDTRKLLYEELPAISKAYQSILLEFRVSCLYWALSAPPKRFCNYFGLSSEEQSTHSSHKRSYVFVPSAYCLGLTFAISF